MNNLLVYDKSLTQNQRKYDDRKEIRFIPGVRHRRSCACGAWNIDYALIILENTGPGNPEITEEEFGRLLRGSLSNETRFDPNQGVLDEIISSGKLAIFNSKELKFALSSWSGLLQGKIARAGAPRYEIQNHRNGEKPWKLKKGARCCA